MKLSMDKYRFYTTKNQVVAVSTYAGKPVRGIAKCDPYDTFSFEYGQELAAARCNEKVANKRLKRAMRRCAAATGEYLEAKRRYEKMLKYLADAQQSCSDAKQDVEAVLSKVN